MPFVSCRNQSIDLQVELTDWFLYGVDVFDGMYF